MIPDSRQKSKYRCIHGLRIGEKRLDDACREYSGEYMQV
jgi:hypothetical protein